MCYAVLRYYKYDLGTLYGVTLDLQIPWESVLRYCKYDLGTLYEGHARSTNPAEIRI